MYTTIEPATTEQVWMSVLRRGLAYGHTERQQPQVRGQEWRAAS